MWSPEIVPAGRRTTSPEAAAASADWKSTPGFGITLTNQAGEEAWPITAATAPEASRKELSAKCA